MFTSKKQYNDLMESNERLRSEIRKMNAEGHFDSLWKENVLSNLRKVEDGGVDSAPLLYTMENETFLLHSRWQSTSMNTHIDMTTYSLSRPIQMSKICTSFSIVSTVRHADKSVGVQRVIELVQIDCMGELRKGHGSKQLRALISIAKLMQVSLIYGEMDRKTFIGLEALESFYRKNGFAVSNAKFKMEL